MTGRSELILEFVDDQGVGSYKKLARLLGVSTMTVRRECERLSRAGKVIKTVGGVRALNGEFVFYEKTAEERMQERAIEKRAIAKQALELIETPSAIFLDGSTTCVSLAKLIDAAYGDVTVVTHSVQICLAMRSGRNNIICAGGDFEPRSLAMSGPRPRPLLDLFLLISRSSRRPGSFRPTEHSSRPSRLSV